MCLKVHPDKSAAANAHAAFQRLEQARQTLLNSCPVDKVSLMRTEIAPLCQESYIATAQHAPFTSTPIDGLDPSRRLPQLTYTLLQTL